MVAALAGQGKEIETVGSGGAKGIGGCACAVGVARMVVKVSEIGLHGGAQWEGAAGQVATWVVRVAVQMVLDGKSAMGEKTATQLFAM